MIHNTKLEIPEAVKIEREKTALHVDRIKRIKIITSLLRTAIGDKDIALTLITRAHELLSNELGGFKIV